MPKCLNCGHITFKTYDGRCADCEIVRLKNELSQARKESDDLRSQKASIDSEKKALDAKYDVLFDEYAKLREKYDRTVFKLQQTKNDDPSIRFDFKEKPSTEPTTSGIKRRRHNTQSIVSANQVIQTEACPVESDPVSRANNSNSDPWFEGAVDGQSQEEIDKYNEALAGCEPIDEVARGEGFEIDDDGHWNYVGDRRDYDD